MYNFNEPRFILKITKSAISPRGPRAWNKILDNHTKGFTSHCLFQKTIKNRLTNLENAAFNCSICFGRQNCFLWALCGRGSTGKA